MRSVAAGFALFLGCLAATPTLAYTTKTGAVGGQTWSAGTYYVSGNLTVAAGTTLTLEPGVIVKVLASRVVDIDGALVAVGTESQPIIWTSRDDDSVGEAISGSDGVPAPGDWRGMEINGYSTATGSALLEHCIFRYGGQVASGNPNSNLFLNYPDSAELRNCRFSQSLKNGLRLAAASPLLEACAFQSNLEHGLSGTTGGTPTIRACTFTDNGLYAAYLSGINMGSGGGNSGSGNGTNLLAFSGDVADGHRLSANEPGLPWGLLAGTEVANGRTYTLGAGVRIKVLAAAELTVTGTLLVQGAPDSLVVLTSVHDDSVDGDSNSNGAATSPAPGDWRGIFVNGYSGNAGVLAMDHARVCYGGNSTGQADACLALSYADSTHVSHCSLESSAQSGARVFVCAPEFRSCSFLGNTSHGLLGASGLSGPIHDCVFTGNGGSAAYVDADAASYGGNSGSGNAVNAIHFNTADVNAPVRWEANADGFAYVVSGQLMVANGASLTLGPGAVVKGQSASSLEVQGSLIGLGTPDSLVVFTSIHDDGHGGDANNNGTATGPAPGDWYEIRCNGYSGAQGIVHLDHAWLGYGGSSASADDCILNFSYCDEARVDHSTFHGSAVDGIRTTTCRPVLESCAFTGNLRNGAYATGTQAADLLDCSFTGNGAAAAHFINSTLGEMRGCTGSGNGLNGLKLQGCQTAANLTLGPTHDLPLVLSGDLSVSTGDTLVLVPGSVLKGEPASTFEVLGYLIATGAEADPIVLSSLRDDSCGGDTNADGVATSPAPGDWNGVLLSGYGGNDARAWLDHVEVYYGGSLGGNIRSWYATEAVLRDCRSEFSSTAGLEVTWSAPLVEDCVFTNNTTEGVRIVDGGQPMLGDLLDTMGGGNTIAGNLGPYQLYNSSNNVIQACYNDWGVYTQAGIDAVIRDNEEGNPNDEVIFAPYLRQDAPPEISYIHGDADVVRIYWTPVLGVAGYVLESSQEPYAGFTPDGSGAFVRQHWEGVRADAERYYRVRAILPE
ncbi:MAG: right-handed parallel beta-helix repeat-containing protein [Candidatus Delongbacteria bacterium]